MARNQINTRQLAIDFIAVSTGLSSPMALLVFLAAAAMAQVIAPGYGNGTHSLNPRADGFPQFAQVVHGPDGFAKRVDPGDAGAGCTLFAQG